MRLLIAVTSLLLVGGLAPALFADDVWVLSGLTGFCFGLQWQADTLLFNRQATPATVRLVSVSDGPDIIPAGQRESVLSPRETIQVAWSGWGPRNDAAVFMLHLDVPQGVEIETLLSIGTGNGTECIGPSIDRTAIYGTIHMPHFRALVPANQEQVHLGTTLGTIRERNNVGIFNAGETPAIAHVELRRSCDDRLADEKTIHLAPNSTVQVQLNNPADDISCEGPVQPWIHYITATVDQPSLTWVSTLANDVEPRVFISIR
jgi:hypothetical protein